MARTKNVPFTQDECSIMAFNELDDEEIGLVSQYTKKTYTMGDDAVRVTVPKLVGRARFSTLNTGNEARMRIKFSKDQKFWRSFNVLQTDYTSFAIVHSCRSHLGWYK